MLSLYGLQPSFSPFMDIPWPVRSLWPEVVPLYHHRDALLKNMQGIETTLKLLEKLQHEIFQKVSQTAASDVVQPLSYAVEKEGGGFALTLDAKGFSPEELSVKQVGRKLRVCGKTEKREEDGKGSYSHRVQELRREFVLPEGVNPEALSCSLADGKLFIQAPNTQQSEKPDRVLTIDSSQAGEIARSETTQTQDSTTETQRAAEQKLG
ncbi:heat shock protein 30-like [Colossoma macropomum]|uniref:heat shock protein 30-like n=1 Tax=Colossoma macropomum TaxID=42526 RepID=UPI001864D211|nr:heat shock protein 30-like [Colossoma macropomum]